MGLDEIMDSTNVKYVGKIKDITIINTHHQNDLEDFKHPEIYGEITDSELKLYHRIEEYHNQIKKNKSDTKINLPDQLSKQIIKYFATTESIKGKNIFFNKKLNKVIKEIFLEISTVPEEISDKLMRFHDESIEQIQEIKKITDLTIEEYKNLHKMQNHLSSHLAIYQEHILKTQKLNNASFEELSLKIIDNYKFCINNNLEEDMTRTFINYERLGYVYLNLNKRTNKTLYKKEGLRYHKKLIRLLETNNQEGRYTNKILNLKNFHERYKKPKVKIQKRKISKPKYHSKFHKHSVLGA